MSAIMSTFARIVNGKPEFCAYENVIDLRNTIQDALGEWDQDVYVPSAKKFSQQVHNHLVLCGHRTHTDEVFYDFDGFYRMEFNISGVDYYFETTCKSQNTLCWNIEEIEK